MECNFTVGQKVVFVDDVPANAGVPRSVGLGAGVEYPVVGNVYTVRSVYKTNRGNVGVKLNEIDNSQACSLLGLPHEYGFEAYRFRPVVERKTDISCFKAMLNPSKEGVPA